MKIFATLVAFAQTLAGLFFLAHWASDIQFGFGFLLLSQGLFNLTRLQNG